MTACKAEKKPADKVKNIIDDAYVTSSEYRSFKQASRSEQEKRKQLSRYMRFFIEENYAASDFLPVPFTLNNAMIRSKIDTNGSTDPFRKDRYFPLGTIQINGFNIFLFLQEKPATYRHILLVGATMKGRDILDIKPLALYKKNLVEQMRSRLSVASGEQIQLQIEYARKYPVSQQIKSVYNFPVTENGRIIVTNTYGFDTLIINDIRRKSPFK